MPDKKLTDAEIVKALECCVRFKQICPETCPMVNVRQCKVDLRKNTLALINRLQAENEELVGNIDRLKAELFDKTEQLEIAKAEAYKECIEKVKALFPSCNEPYQYWEIHEGADNLLKELVGGDIG